MHHASSSGGASSKSSSEQFEERVFEVEALRGNQWSSAFLNEADGPAFFDGRGEGRALASLESVTPPLGWQWSSNWRVVLDYPGANAEGWVVEGRIRRRRWRRTRERIPSTSSAVSGSASSSEHYAARRAGTNQRTEDSRAASFSAPAEGMSEAAALQLLETALKHIRRLEEAGRSLERIASGVEGPSKAAEWMERGKDEILSAERTLEVLASRERKGAVTTAARMKLSKELGQLAKQFHENAQLVTDSLRRRSRPAASPFAASSTAMARRDVPDRGAEEESNGSAARAMIQEQMQEERLVRLVGEVEINESIIEHRAEQLKEINRVAVTVNTMMKDLAGMVESQGVVLEQASKNVATARDDVQRGYAEVVKAEKHQTDPSCSVQ